MYICVANADALATVFTNPNIAAKGISYKFLEPLMGSGLFTTNGKVVHPKQMESVLHGQQKTKHCLLFITILRR